MENGYKRERKLQEDFGMKVNNKKKMISLLFLVIFIISCNVIYWHNRAFKEGDYFIDVEGNIVSKRYEIAGSFQDGITSFTKKEGDKDIYYYMDTSFRVIGSAKYYGDLWQESCNGEAIFIHLDKNGIEIFNKEMKPISNIPYVFDGIDNMRWSDKESQMGNVGPNGLFPLKDKKSGLWGYYDIKGNEVIAPKFERAKNFNSDDVAIVRMSDGYRIIDSDGNYKLENPFKEIYLCGNGIAYVQKDEDSEFQFIDLEGNVLTDEKIKYTDSSKRFSDGFLPVQIGEYAQSRWGFIDSNMEYLVEPQYETVHNFANEMAGVENKDGLWGYVDITGQEVIPCQFESVYDFGEYDLAPIKVNGKYGMIRKDGSYYIEPYLDDIRPFSDGYACVHLKKGQKVKVCK
ncbi:MAG: WG repeat-containing protein [Butyrivibrio sp.]|nr:WG repeat-containing protein [Butyrivibrio sp.]